MPRLVVCLVLALAAGSVRADAETNAMDGLKKLAKTLEEKGTAEVVLEMKPNGFVRRMFKGKEIKVELKKTESADFPYEGVLTIYTIPFTSKTCKTKEEAGAAEMKEQGKRVVPYVAELTWGDGKWKLKEITLEIADINFKRQATLETNESDPILDFWRAIEAAIK